MHATATAARLRELSPLQPSLGLVLGSGFHPVAAAVEGAIEVRYSNLPGFPQTTVAGHEGKVLIGRLGGTPVIVLCGRVHYYEGHAMEQVTFPVRVLAEFGIEHLLLSNAAGGINRKFKAGDFMMLSDHINMMGVNPLRGPVPMGHPRFVDLTRCYDPRLAGLLKKAARALNIVLRSGVYLAVSGPSYETPAEIRAFGRLGADAVGMSTVPEAITARQYGVAVAGLSCITNLAAGLTGGLLSHADVLEQADRNKVRAVALLRKFASLYGQE
jgi:purine-nucleoside phosphorylase